MTKSEILNERRELKRRRAALFDILVNSGGAVTLLELFLSQIKAPVSYLSLQGTKAEEDMIEGAQQALKQAEKIHSTILAEERLINRRIERLRYK